MTRRHFWQVPEYVKFRTVFENDDTILGVNAKGEHKLFRKDTGCISFSKRAKLSKRIINAAQRESITRVVRLVPKLTPQPVY